MAALREAERVLPRLRRATRPPPLRGGGRLNQAAPPTAGRTMSESRIRRAEEGWAKKAKLKKAAPKTAKTNE
jgi:hypothetical protein